MPIFATDTERDLLDLVRGRGVSAIAVDAPRLRRVTQLAREHGVEGFVPSAAPETAPGAARELALRMQHDTRLREVGAIGAELAHARVDCVLLKGVGVAERFYERPWMRGSSDIDLLVMPDKLDVALDAIARLGYEVEQGARARFFRERHFHVMATSPVGTLAEIHFIAYRGFGSEITAADLFAGRVPLARLPTLFVPAPARELVYLAVHAAAHRFARIGWLADLLLILRHAEPTLLAEARAFAASVRFAGAFELALSLLRSRFGLTIPGEADARIFLAESIADEPQGPILRSATRFLYAALLCDGVREQGRYAARAIFDKFMFPSE